MTKRKTVTRDSDSNNALHSISTRNKRCKRSRGYKSDSSKNDVKICNIDASVNSEESNELVASKSAKKKRSDNIELQNDNTRNNRRCTRSRAHKANQSDVEIIESDGVIDTRKPNEVVAGIDTDVHNDNEEANNSIAIVKQKNDTIYLSINDGTQQCQASQLIQADPSLETTKDIHNDSSSQPIQVNPSLETTKDIDKDSEINREAIQCRENIIEQTGADQSLEIIEEVDKDPEINEQTMQHIQQIIEQMDADPSLETIEEIGKNPTINQQTVQCINKTTEETGVDPSLKTIEDVDGDSEINEQSVQHKDQPSETIEESHRDLEINDQTVRYNEKTIEQLNADQHLESTEEVDKDSEQNQQTIQHVENTIKQMDACVCTDELEELLKKKQIYPWTRLYQIQDKNNIDTDDESEEENGRRDQCIQTIPVAKEWQHIISAMEDPSGVVSYTDKLLIIKERQPKGRFHYLIIPVENMRNINELRKEHIPMLNNMEEAAKEVISNFEHAEDTFVFGFITKPTMIVLRNQKFLWLHMHVISSTPNFSYITKKNVWNTFHSKMFITLKEVKNFLATTGIVPMPTPEDCNLLLTDDVTCNQCDFSSPKLPKLVEHIKEVHSQKEKIKKKKKRK